MRIEVEGDRTTLREVVKQLDSSREPVELTRDGEVVAKVVAVKKKVEARKVQIHAAPTEAERAKAGRELWAMTEDLRAKTKRAGLTQTQVDQMVNKAVREVRRENAARSR